MTVPGAPLPWNPERYLAAAGPRLRPAIDLLARVPAAAPARVADLGCGPGNATRLLAERWPQARLLGVDSSGAMLARARQEGPAADWVEADIDQQRGEAVLIVAGHAASDDKDANAVLDDMLRVLIVELPLKQAATIASKLTGIGKNT